MMQVIGTLNNNEEMSPPDTAHTEDNLSILYDEQAIDNGKEEMDISV